MVLTYLHLRILKVPLMLSFVSIFMGVFFFKPTLMEIEWGVVNDYGDRMGIYEAYNIHPSKLNDIQ